VITNKIYPVRERAERMLTTRKQSGDARDVLTSSAFKINL